MGATVGVDGEYLLLCCGLLCDLVERFLLEEKGSV